ncbi:MAG: hypothetical protein V3U57_04480 [Robiginitomaculum sp.]
MQKEIDIRRKENEKRFIAITSGRSPMPTLKYVGDDLEESLRKIRNNESGTIVVSFHTKSYFLLLQFLLEVNIPCIAITTEALSKRLNHSKYMPPKGLEFSATLGRKELKKCINNECILFIMADVLIDYASNTWIPLQNKCVRYTISWAELAYKLKLNVFTTILKEQNNTATVHLKSFGNFHSSVTQLVYSVFDTFGSFIEKDIIFWENYPEWQATGITLPPLDKGLTEELLATLYDLAVCDQTVINILRNQVNQ